MPIDKKNIEKIVKKAIADKLDVDVKRVKNSSALTEDLGMDSFGAVELTFELKDKLGIEIPQEEFFKIKKVNDIVNYISNNLQGGNVC